VPGDADRPPNTFRGKFAIFVTLIHNRPTLPHLIGSARERDLLHNPFYDLLVQPFQRALLHPPLSATRIYDANVHSRWAMMVVHGVFDSEALSLMQAELEHAWAALPPDRQTAETRERIAQAVVRLAMLWERDPAQPGAVSPAERAKISLGVD
jgi:hypothetical protein